ncbi:hypothetical protein COLO4_36688 [Corchorus olitorius]|uniref:Uncharacterized protein n=1 Tax=Corchorus olitorius TaxID=93759 RepID=A0A1R3G6I4_9ROSI|nr:hypothetical protein COLO4_36688 [Corchorus olitorius]
MALIFFIMKINTLENELLIWLYFQLKTGLDCIFRQLDKLEAKVEYVGIAEVRRQL